MKTDKTLITIYTCGAFGITKMHATLVAINDVLHRPGFKSVEFVEKGKRKSHRISSGSMIVLAGHLITRPPSGMEANADGSESSRYGSFDPRYNHEFNKFADSLVSTLSQDLVLLDQRTNRDTE